jgi:hypothetical protein
MGRLMLAGGQVAIRIFPDAPILWNFISTETVGNKAILYVK